MTKTNDPIEGWKRGLPPGDFYPAMVEEFEVYFSPGGMKWHRRRATNSTPPASVLET